MIYAFVVTVPANTPESDPVMEELEMDKGVIRKLSIQIPPGHAGLCKFALFRGDSQVWPKNRDEKFAGDGVVLEFDDEYFPLLQPPYSLFFVGWNEDELNDHKVFIYFQLLTREQYLSQQGVYWPEEGFV